jgi:hypothetical protein
VEEHAILANAQHGGRVGSIDGAGPETVGNKNDYIAWFSGFFLIAMLISGKGGNGQQKGPHETQGRSATHRFLLNEWGKCENKTALKTGSPGLPSCKRKCFERSLAI